LPDTATTLFAAQDRPETLCAIVQGQIWVSSDGAKSWSRRGLGLLSANIDVLTIDPGLPARYWAAAGDLLFRSDDGGAHWLRAGRPVPEPNMKAHGLAAGEEGIVVATDRGLFHSGDRGDSWTLIGDNLPAHLEAGMLVRDPVDPATLYAGFSLIPYTELWRRAASGEGTLARVSLTSLAGGVVLLALLALAAVVALRRLAPYYRSSVRETGRMQL